jgi:hypothetical protein
MRSQYHRGHADFLGEFRRKSAHIDIARVPILPVLDVAVPDALEGMQKRRDRQRRSRSGAAAEAECEHRMACADFAHQCDIARFGRGIFPRHPSVPCKILPAVADADITGAQAQPHTVLRDRVCRGQSKRIRPPRGAKCPPIAIPENLRRILRSAAGDMRREQRVCLEIGVAGELAFDEQDIAIGIGDDA